jgi:hypothetical protein
MTDLETFRQALKACDLPEWPGSGPGVPCSSALDADQIMARGRSLRRRRRLAAAGGSLCLAAAVFAAVTSIGHLSRPSPVPALSSPHSAGPAAGGTGRPAPRAQEGRVIPSGIRVAGGEVVFYGVRIHNHQLPGVSFGIMAALRGPTGELTPEVETNETTGSGSSSGFHAVQAASSVGSPAVAIPEFGYYAGPAATITARAGGRQVQAHLTRWSANPRIVIFWFTPASTASAPRNLAAHSTAGHPLPAGNSAPGHG